MSNIFFSAVMAIVFFFGPVLSHADDHWMVHDKVILTSTSTLHLYQQGVAKTWHDGGVQGGQALVQIKLIPRYTREQVKLFWQKQKGTCPSDSQITEFQKGWDMFIVWAEQTGRYEEVVTIISSWNHKTRAPGPIIITAIIDAIAGGAKAAIGGVFFERAMAAVRPSNNTYTANQTGAGATVGDVTAKTAPVTAITGPSYSTSGSTSGSNSISGSVGGDGSVAGSGSVGGSTGVNAGP